MLLVVSYWFVLFGTVHTTPTPLPDITELCPYNTFCLIGPLKVLNQSGKQPCCSPCSCDADCVLFGNCCPDMPLRDAIPPKYKCVDLRNYFKQINNLSLDLTVQLAYIMIDDCPNKMAELLYPRCLHPLKHNLLDYVIVSDPNNDRVYKNRHCALCHGYQKFVEWQIFVECREIMASNFMSIEEKDEYLINNCAIVALPRNGITLSKSSCHDPGTIKSCNVTGDWDMVGKDIYTPACTRERPGQSTLYLSVNQRRRTFANVYCHLCNHPVSSSMSGVCDIPKIFLSGREFRVKFTGIIDLRANMEVNEVSTCLHSQIFDPLKNMCRELICPSGSYPYSGNCRSVLSEGYGFAIKMYFKIVLLKGTFNIETQAERQLGEILRQWFSFAKSQCQICQSAMGYVENGTSLTANIVLHSDGGCTPDYLLTRARTLALTEPIYVTLRDGAAVTQISIHLLLHTPEKTHVGTGGKICFAVVIDRTILHHCPAISLTEEERIAFNTKLNKKSSNVHPRISDENTMCVEDYISLSRATETISVLQFWYIGFIAIFLLCANQSYYS